MEDRILRTEALISLLKAVSHPLRLQIIDLLKAKGDLTAGEIEDILGQEQSLISHHLKHLKKVNMVESQRQGRKQTYGLNDEKWSRIQPWIDEEIL